MLRQKKDAAEENRQQKMCSLGSGPIGVHTPWGRLHHLKAALKHYFVKFRLLQFSDLSYWSAGEQAVGHGTGGGQGGDLKKKIKSHQLLGSAFFEKAHSEHWSLEELPRVPVGCGMSRRRGFFTLQKTPLQQDCNKHLTQQKIRPSEAKPARSHSCHTPLATHIVDTHEHTLY